MVYLNIQNQIFETVLKIKELSLIRACCDETERHLIEKEYPTIDIYSEPGSCPGSPISIQSVAAQAQIKLTPNPTDGIVFITGINPDEINSISIFTLDGQSVFQQKSPSKSIDISNLPAASYLVQIELFDGSLAKSKLIKK